MKNYRVILFDLDGTLTDPGVGITKSVQYALARYGITVPDRSRLYKFIGPPLKDAFMTYCGFSREQAAQALAYYREYYCEKGIFENQVYPGIPALLQQLQDAGRQLLVATSKPEIFAREILEHFQLSRYFSFVAGSDLEEIPEESVLKSEVTGYCFMGNFGENQLAWLNRIIMRVFPYTYRIWGSPASMYDGMIFVTEAHPTRLR